MFNGGAALDQSPVLRVKVKAAQVHNTEVATVLRENPDIRLTELAPPKESKDDLRNRIGNTEVPVAGAAFRRWDPAGALTVSRRAPRLGR